MQTGLEIIEKECSEYLLVAHDWSLVNYRNHTTKDDCIETKRSNSTNAISKGYDLQSIILPFVENDDEIFLKSIIPSRKLKKEFKGSSNEKR